tara:strand:- start:7845 stop:11804 length:3960 start_codon:yes stop_codon:yes gene_type:complete
MEQINPYEALTQSREGSFSNEALEDNAALLSDSQAKVEEKQQKLDEAAAGPSATAMDAEQEIQEVEQKEEKKTNDGLKQYTDTLGDIGENVLEFIDTASEFGQAPAAGTVDFAIDAFNLTPANIPKLPKFKNDIAQGFREISSVVIPTFFLSRLGIKGGQLANAKVNAAIKIPKLGTWNIAKDPLVKLFSVMGLEAGVGAAVDYTSSTSKEGLNATGAMKKYLPELFHWIPDDIAVLDDDHPDVKRDKSVKEGVALGPFTDLLLGAARIARGIKGNMSIRGKFLPENETATAYWKDPTAATDNEKVVDVMGAAKDSVETSVKARMDALTDLGKYNSSTDASLDKPMLGVNPEYFEATEQGVRSVDPNGVHGAAVDAARIYKNKNTVYGRMGSIITEGALKHGLEADSITQRTFIKQIKESLAAGGKYSYRDSANNLSTSKEIAEAGDALAAVLFDPRVTVQQMKAILEENKNVMEGLQVLDRAGFQGVMKALKMYKDDYFNLDTLKAQSYLVHSLAGQASDMAEGMRLVDGTAAVERAQEQIIDRITYLTAETGLARKLGSDNLRNMNMWKKIRNMLKKDANEAAQTITDKVQDALASSVENARRYRDTLQNIRQSRPEFLKPLMYVNELTDGNVDSMYKLSLWTQNKLGTIEKGFIDGSPEIQSEVLKGAYGNLYNSLLSSIATPAKAGAANIALLLEKPAAVMIGGMASRDWNTVRRGWYQFSALSDTLQKGFSHMGMVFAKASRDPNSVPYMVRDDIATRQADEMAVLRMSADAYAQNDEMGPSIMLDYSEALFDLQNHPFLRWGTNALSALDGFNRAVMANGEALGMAYDKMLKSGEKINGKAYRKAADDYYASMFDKDGFIVDGSVDYMSRESTMSLDNKLADGISGITTHLPALKPWLLFNRTPANILSAFWNRSLTSTFVGDYNRIVGPPGKVHSTGEIQQILESRNIPNDEFALQRFKTLQAEIKGRVALGQIAVAGAVGLFMNDRITGNGHYDKERQTLRREMGWAPKSIKGLDGKYYSYGELGPLADWLAATVDVLDNFDLLSVHAFEDFQRKMGFILGASVFNRSTLQGLQPLMDVLSGNPASWQRWAATTASGFAPISGLRNEIGRVMYPELKVMDEEFGHQLRNRNKYLDKVDPKGALPALTDWVDGTVVNYVEGFWERLVQASFPVKVKEAPSELRQFLIDIEYDARPTFAKSKGGITLDNTQRAELFSLIGSQGEFRKELQKIKKDADAMDFIGKLRKARREFRGNDDVIIEEFGAIYSRIDKALREAKEIAEESISSLDDIRTQEIERDQNIQLNQYGIIQNK